MKKVNFVEMRLRQFNEYTILNLKLNGSSISRIYDESFGLPDVQKLLVPNNDYKFDLVIVESMFNIPWYTFAVKYNAPLIAITSLDASADVHESLGNVINPTLHTDFWLEFCSPLTFKQRWKSLKFYLWNKFYYEPQLNKIYDDIIRKHFPNLQTSAHKLRNSIQLLLTNTHPLLDFVRPVAPTTIQLGFMHIKQPKPLPNKLREYLESADTDVIYMSLGSNVKSLHLGKKYLSILINVFKKLPFKVLWKFEDDKLLKKPENVVTKKWFPQADLLAHPRIKLFITQGGQQSMEESIDRAVPMIVLPFFADQTANAQKIARKKIGVRIDLLQLSEEKLLEAINEALMPDYKKNIEHLAKLIHDQPMTSREKAVWHVEYVLRHNGTKHLNYIGKLIPFYQTIFLDIIVFALISFYIVLKLCFAVLKYLK
jgi:glucuronosyltransferase